MLIRQPENDLLIRTGEHIEARIPFHNAQFAFPRQRRHRRQVLLRVGAGLRVPHHGVAVAAASADDVAPVGTKAGVALAGDVVVVVDGWWGTGDGTLEGGVEGEVFWGAGEEGFDDAGEGVEEEMGGVGGCGGKEEGFAVVGEGEGGPGAGLGGGGGGGVEVAEVESGEGGFVVVSAVVEEDGGGRGGGDGNDGGGGVVGGEGGGCEVEAALRGGGGEGPEADGVVGGAGEEGVGGGGEGDGGDGGGVRFEVAEVLVVVGG